MILQGTTAMQTRLCFAEAPPSHAIVFKASHSPACPAVTTRVTTLCECGMTLPAYHDKQIERVEEFD